MSETKPTYEELEVENAQLKTALGDVSYRLINAQSTLDTITTLAVEREHQIGNIRLALGLPAVDPRQNQPIVDVPGGVLFGADYNG